MTATTVGVIGCGYWGPNLLRNLAEHEAAELRWICECGQSAATMGRIRPRKGLFQSDINVLCDLAPHDLSIKDRRRGLRVVRLLEVAQRSIKNGGPKGQSLFTQSGTGSAVGRVAQSRPAT